MIDMTKYSKSRYLRATDLTASRTPVRIRSVTEEPVGNPPEEWPVLRFTTAKLNPLVLRKQRLEAVVEGLGLDETQWVGKVIHLLKVRITMNGKPTDSIQIFVPPQPTSPPPPPVVTAPVEVPPVAEDDVEDLT